uniref:Uncharacterized protein n=1 Tax=Oryza glumipatula TaxID=40148 RepID=A0A0D9ZW48_9ORYZ
MSFDAVSRRETSPPAALEEEMATVTQAPAPSTPSMVGNPDGGAPAAAADQSATGGEALVGEGRLRKGKMVAEDQSPPSVSGGAPADLHPGGDKLAENGGGTDTLLLGARRRQEDAIAMMTPSMKENVRKCKMAGLRAAAPAARWRPRLAAILGAGRPPHVAADEATPPPGAKKPKPDHTAFFWTALGHNMASTTSAGSDAGATLDNIAVVDDNLRANLRYLVASPWRPPARVYGKKMTFTDRSVAQHRLLMSCKGWHSTHRGGDEPFPFEELLTPAEKAAAADGDEGLRVQAYDRAGRDYDLKCKFLSCNDAYRLILEWSEFLKENHLDVKDKNAAMANEAMIDLWAFRSRWLSHGVDGHEDGRLGLVMVHYFRGDAPHADAAMDVHDALMQARKAKLKKNKEEAGSSSSSSSSKVKKNKEENGSSSSSSGEALAVVGALPEEKNGDAGGEADVQGGAPAAVEMSEQERLAQAANGMRLPLDH